MSLSSKIDLLESIPIEDEDNPNESPYHSGGEKTPSQPTNFPPYAYPPHPYPHHPGFPPQHAAPPYPYPYPPYPYPLPPPGQWPQPPTQTGSAPTSPATSQPQIRTENKPRSQVSLFFDKMAQQIFVTKQKVLETIGQVEVQIDEKTQAKIDKLKEIVAQYDKIIVAATQLMSNWKAFFESQKQLGDHFYEFGMKEEEVLGDALRESGNLHRALDKQSPELLDTLKAFLDKASTFRNAAVADTLITYDKYTKSRQEYNGSLLRLEDIKHNARQGSGRITEAQLIVEESEKLMNRYSDDLFTKVIILNEKRVQELSNQLVELVKGLRNYFLSCDKVVEQFDFEVKGGTTTDFKKLMANIN